MATSPLLGTESAPTEPEGRDTGALGPSDSSDSGSDMAGIRTGGEAALPLEEALQEAAQPDMPRDIDTDRVIEPQRDAAAPEPREPGPNPEPDAPAPTEPSDPSDPAAPPADPDDDEHRRPGRVAALLRRP